MYELQLMIVNKYYIIVYHKFDYIIIGNKNPLIEEWKYSKDSFSIFSFQITTFLIGMDGYNMQLITRWSIVQELINQKNGIIGYILYE